MNERIVNLRKESGTITSSDRLVSFLYCLMRDHLPTSTVESLVIDTIALSEDTKDCIFTNGYLAQYAQNLAKILKE